MNEFEKLRNLLKENNIPFEENLFCGHIGYPCFGKSMICSIVSTTHSLEIMGLIDDEYYEYNEECNRGGGVTQDGLTAEDVFNKINAYHLCQNKDQEYIFAAIFSERKIYTKNTHRPKDIFSNDQIDKLNNTVKLLEEIMPILRDNEYWHYFSEIDIAKDAIESVYDNFKKENQK